MIQQRFVLLTLAICLLSFNVFAQKNTGIQPEVTSVKQQPQATVIIHTTEKEVTPLHQRVTKTEVDTQNEQINQPKTIARPRFGSVMRPKSYANLDDKIEKIEQKITLLEADPNRDETTLVKYYNSLERLQKIKAKTTKSH